MAAPTPTSRFEAIGNEPLGTPSAFGRVWHARVLTSEDRKQYGSDVVAIKVPLNSTTERFLKEEIKGLFARLELADHSNLVRSLDFVPFDDRISMVMEYMWDGDLRARLDRLKRGQQLSPSEAHDYTRQLLAGVAELHRHRIFHRDLKPENVMFSGDRLAIGDFGLSTILEQSGLYANGQAGTMPYMAPECFTFRGTIRSDVWAVGVMAYEMYAGHHPFYYPGMGLGALSEAIRRTNPRPLHTVSRVSPAMSAVIMKSLERRTSARFRNAAVMQAAFREAFEPVKGVIVPPPPMDDPKPGAETEAVDVQPAEPPPTPCLLPAKPALEPSGVCSDGEYATAAERCRAKGPAEVANVLAPLFAAFPRDARLHRLVGEAHNLVGSHGEAAAAFQRASGLDPANARLSLLAGHAFTETALALGWPRGVSPGAGPAAPGLEAAFEAATQASTHLREALRLGIDRSDRALRSDLAKFGMKEEINS